MVPHRIRRQGIAHKLLSQLETWADKNGVCIINEISPYNDGGLDMQQLLELYSHHGFVSTGVNNIMIRFVGKHLFTTVLKEGV